MNFQSATGAKAWRDIWGSGQGIGMIDKVTPAAELIARLAQEYARPPKRESAARRIAARDRGDVAKLFNFQATHPATRPDACPRDRHRHG